MEDVENENPIELVNDFNQEVALESDEGSRTATTTNLSSIAPDHRCPICLDLLHEPLSLEPCNHTFCDPCLRRLGNERHSRCPVCRAEIARCQLNEEIKAIVQEAHPGQYDTRAETEANTDVYDLPLPPIRRPMLERLSDWILMNLSSPYFLTTLALIAVLVQLMIVVTLSLLTRSRWSSSVLSVLRNIKGAHSGWRRPVMVKVILVYNDNNESTIYDSGPPPNQPDALDNYSIGGHMFLDYL